LSDLDIDQLIHTAEGRLVLEVMQGRRLPIMVVMQDKGEMVFWYPPAVLNNLLPDAERLLEWVRILEDHTARMQALVTKQ